MWILCTCMLSSQHQISKYLALGLTVHTYSVTTGCLEASEWAGSKSSGFCVGVTTMELENCQDGHAVQPELLPSCWDEGRVICVAVTCLWVEGRMLAIALELDALVHWLMLCGSEGLWVPEVLVCWQAAGVSCISHSQFHWKWLYNIIILY